MCGQVLTSIDNVSMIQYLILENSKGQIYQYNYTNSTSKQNTVLICRKTLKLKINYSKKNLQHPYTKKSPIHVLFSRKPIC